MMKKFGLVFCLAAMVLISGCAKSNPPPTPKAEQPPAKEQQSPAAVNEPVTSAAAEKPAISDSLKKIISNREGWDPILTNFYGKEMPDFKVQDINGKAHSLSDYRGKNVVVVFWATWCVPCMQEVPNLKALREIMPEDKVAIMAISNEPVDKVKATAKADGMNYTVISHPQALPVPFSSIRGFPSAFFIRPDGTLKLVIEGGAGLGEMKSIILAE